MGPVCELDHLMADGDPRVGLLVCPDCRGDLSWAGSAASCNRCGHEHTAINGVPVLVPMGGLEPHKRAQAKFFDSEPAEFELTRPHGQPALYGDLIEQRFRRAVGEFEERLRGSVAVAVCGGSGMDAELLAAAGARPISIDISPAAALRARHRGERFGADILSLVGDVERLPFRDRSVPVVYVHDGLHHLSDPYRGLAELARVTASALIVTEPAAAAITAISVRLGISQRIEEAGNPVKRIDPRELQARLEELGFRIEEIQRYAMFYRHRPGPAMGLFSRPRLRPIARTTLAAANAVVGWLGNKLAVQAVRER